MIEVSSQPGFLNVMEDHLLKMVFLSDRESLTAIACVSKKWSALINELYPEVYRLVESKIKGRAKWMELGFGDPGIEPLLPRWMVLTFNPEVHLLTLIPKTTVKDGEVIPVNALNLGRMWAEKMNIQGQMRPGFDDDSWGTAIDEERDPVETHWDLLDKKEIGLSTAYPNQVALAREQGGQVSRFVSTVAAWFLEHADAGEKHVEWDPANGKYRFVRVQDITGRSRVGLGFAAGGLDVTHGGYGHADDSFGVVVSRKSLGH